MDTYDANEKDQDGIEIAYMIWNICHLQDDEKQYAMDAVETDKQVRLFYQSPYHSKQYYLEHSKAHIKVSEAHNGEMVYHMLSVSVALK